MKQVTLLFIRQHGSILLAMKKRGFGQGLWNGVGGKVEPHETVEAAAIRECREEIGITPLDIRPIGRLAFYLNHDRDFGHDIHIFVAHAWEGEPRETSEMRPQWFKINDIPYDTMWPDDILWLPYLIDNQPFSGSITLDAHNHIVEATITPLTDKE